MSTANASCYKCQAWSNDMVKKHGRDNVVYWDKDQSQGRCYPNNWNETPNYNTYYKCGTGQATKDSIIAPFDCSAFPTDTDPNGSCKDCSDCANGIGSNSSSNSRENMSFREVNLTGPWKYKNLNNTWGVQMPFQLG